MTTALYYTPNGTSIQALGIVPHVEFVYRLEDGSEYLPFTERDLTGHLTNDSPARKESPILTLEALKTFDHYGEPDTPDGEAPAEAADDYQILLAADILRLATDPDPDRMVQSASRLLDPMK